MTSFLKKHPIITSVLLGVLMLIAVLIVSSANGHRYYYRIANVDGQIKDVSIEQVTNDYKPLHMLDMVSVEDREDGTLVYFDAVAPGNGLLQIHYILVQPDGHEIEFLNSTKLIVSRNKIIYIGEGIYNRNGIFVIHYGIALYALLMMFYFVWRRRSLRKDNRYSYDYMSTWAGQMFFLGVFLTYASAAITSVIWLSYIDVYMMDAVTRYLTMFLTAFTFPFVLIFGIAMTISNISLIRHEGKRLANMLGIFTGIFLFIAILVIAFLFLLFLLLGKENVFIAVTYSVISALYIVFFAVLVSAVISGLLAGRYTPVMDKDYIIILGCAIKKDGTLYPLIRGRVDRAIGFWKQQNEKCGKKAVFVPSGGKGSDEIIAEGEAMKRYLLDQGIPEEYILAETKSVNTIENMKFSKELIDAHSAATGSSANIAFSTTNFHVMRSGILASKVGIKAEGMGAPTKWYFWPNALLREVVGMFAAQPKTQLFTIVIFALLAGGVGYAYYFFM